MGDPIVVNTNGGEDDKPNTEVAHELGSHDEKIKQHDALLEEIKAWMTNTDGRVESLASRTADVPQEVWERLGAVEDKVLQLPGKVEELLSEEVNQPLPTEPEPVQVQKAPEPQPKDNNSGKNPIHRFLHGLR